MVSEEQQKKNCFDVKIETGNRKCFFSFHVIDFRFRILRENKLVCELSLYISIHPIFYSPKKGIK